MPGSSSDGKIDLSKKTKAFASVVMNKVHFESEEDADSDRSGDKAVSPKATKEDYEPQQPCFVLFQSGII